LLRRGRHCQPQGRGARQRNDEGRLRPRRATLSLCGLGFLDETEVADIPITHRPPPPAPNAMLQHELPPAEQRGGGDRPVRRRPTRGRGGSIPGGYGARGGHAR
jgi:hypothetical protein